ncbi:hypothetical protein Hypma_012742 [Hypsizygus marmoreus]|uniref:Uncharacterized protein n=1 Tax=Hypsizygus marmoreus TaxID=39966 RepID=A0A369JDA8_HYPMA|nr:hypothetical protein Hypma_012742 [Hypsizygus marmoreus]
MSVSIAAVDSPSVNRDTTQCLYMMSPLRQADSTQCVSSRSEGRGTTTNQRYAVATSGYQGQKRFARQKAEAHFVYIFRTLSHNEHMLRRSVKYIHRLKPFYSTGLGATASEFSA